VLRISRNKAGKKLRIEITGELAAVIGHILARSKKITGLALIQDGNGWRLSYSALRSRFDSVRRTAQVNFQFRDVKAKARRTRMT